MKGAYIKAEWGRLKWSCKHCFFSQLVLFPPDCKKGIMCYRTVNKIFTNMLLFTFSLSTKLMAVAENAAESWIAMGYFCLATHKAARTVYFGQKVLTFVFKFSVWEFLIILSSFEQLIIHVFLIVVLPFPVTCRL